MKSHNCILRREAIALINQGYNQKEVSLKLEVTEKTIGTWVKKWKELDGPKKDTILKLRQKLNNIALDCFTTTSEIKEIVDSIVKLEGELIIQSIFIDV